MTATEKAPQVKAAGRQRAIWMDVVRGLAIIAVVYGHADAIGVQRGLFDREEWQIVSNQILVLVRMPLLMFLSGMLLPRSIAKGWRSFLPGKFTKLAWPYVVWISLFFVLLALHDLGSLSEIPMNILRPENPNRTVLWYLRNLFFYYLIAQLIVWVRLPLWTGALAGFALSIYQVTENWEASTTELRFGGLMTFFFLGAFAAQHLDRVLAFCRTWFVIPISLGIFAGGAYIYVSGMDSVRYRPEYVWIPLFFIIFVLGVAPRITSSAWTKPLEFIGRNSLYYYVMHYHLFMLYCWHYGETADIGRGNHFLFLMAIGLIVPTITVFLAKRIPPIAWAFFELPWPKKRAK